MVLFEKQIEMLRSFEQEARGLKVSPDTLRELMTVLEQARYELMFKLNMPLPSDDDYEDL